MNNQNPYQSLNVKILLVILFFVYPIYSQANPSTCLNVVTVKHDTPNQKNPKFNSWETKLTKTKYPVFFGFNNKWTLNQQNELVHFVNDSPISYLSRNTEFALLPNGDLYSVEKRIEQFDEKTLSFVPIFNLNYNPDPQDSRSIIWSNTFQKTIISINNDLFFLTANKKLQKLPIQPIKNSERIKIVKDIPEFKVIVIEATGKNLDKLYLLQEDFNLIELNDIDIHYDNVRKLLARIEPLKYMNSILIGSNEQDYLINLSIKNNKYTPEDTIKLSKVSYYYDDNSINHGNFYESVNQYLFAGYSTKLWSGGSGIFKLENDDYVKIKNSEFYSPSIDHLYRLYDLPSEKIVLIDADSFYYYDGKSPIQKIIESDATNLGRFRRVFKAPSIDKVFINSEKGLYLFSNLKIIKIKMPEKIQVFPWNEIIDFPAAKKAILMTQNGIFEIDDHLNFTEITNDIPPKLHKYLIEPMYIQGKDTIFFSAENNFYYISKKIDNTCP